MITHGSDLGVSLWHHLRTFHPGPIWKQSGEWSFGQPPSASHWQGRTCRGMESLVPLQGPGRVEGGQALWLPGPTGFGDLLVTEKSRVLKRPPDSPHSLQNFMASGGLVGIAWCTSIWPRPQMDFCQQQGSHCIQRAQ